MVRMFGALGGETAGGLRIGKKWVTSVAGFQM